MRSRYPISLPDGYLLATARQLGAVTTSFDRKILGAAEAEGIATCRETANQGE